MVQLEHLAQCMECTMFSEYYLLERKLHEGRNHICLVQVFSIYLLGVE